MYETYRSIQKSLKAFIEHITEVSKSFEELKNMDLNGILSIHQDKILSLKHDLQETRKKKEETLKIVKKYLTKEVMIFKTSIFHMYEHMYSNYSMFQTSKISFLYCSSWTT